MWGSGTPQVSLGLVPLQLRGLGEILHLLWASLSFSVRWEGNIRVPLVARTTVGGTGRPCGVGSPSN